MAVVFTEITLTCAGTNITVIYSCTKKVKGLLYLRLCWS